MEELSLTADGLRFRVLVHGAEGGPEPGLTVSGAVESLPLP